MPTYLQYDKEMFESWSYHTPCPDPSLIAHPWDNLGWFVHVVSFPSRPVSRIRKLAG